MSKLRLLIVFLMVSFTLFAEEEQDDQTPLIDLTGIPSSVVGGCVNTITGSYFESHNDITIPGPNPLSYSTSFNSNHILGCNLATSWSVNLPGALTIERPKSIKGRIAKFMQNGSVLHFDCAEKSKVLIPEEKQLRYGVTNCASGRLSAKDNFKNMSIANKDGSLYCAVHYSEYENIKFKLSEGVKRYKIFVPDAHYFPNRCYYKYEYRQYPSTTHLNVIAIESKGLSDDIFGKINISQYTTPERMPEHLIYSSDGRSVIYKYEKLGIKTDLGNARYSLSQVISAHQPNRQYTYKYVDEKTVDRLVKSALPDGRYRNIKYYEIGSHKICGNNVKIKKNKDSRYGRVSVLSGPIGKDNSPLPMYRFVYRLDKDKVSKKPIGGVTTVFNPYENKTDYQFSDEHRLTNIKYFRQNGALYRSEHMEWGHHKSYDYTHLISRGLYDRSGRILSQKSYEYDKKGNVLAERTSGDLRGKGKIDIHSKFYKYSIDNQLIFEDDGQKQISYTYYPKTELPKSMLIYGSGIRERYFCDYDDNGVLILEIQDDGTSQSGNNLSGITERHIKRIQPTTMLPIGLPGIVEEKYLDLKTQKEVLIKKTVFSYSSVGLPVKEEVYDGNGQFAYSKAWDYDAMGNVICEKDPLGQITTYQYDANKNRIYSRSGKSDFYIAYAYDYSNRLIRESEVYDNGTTLTRSYTYDLCSNKISSTDVYGNTTNYVYDEFNRLIQTTRPDVIRPNGTLVKFVESCAYDELNHVTLKVDANGYATQYTHNARGKPTSIVHPDGAIETHFYTIYGDLEKSILPNEAYILYQYDYKNRVILKQNYTSSGDLISQQAWIYNAFQLVQEIDTAGVRTYYTYDNAGRLINTVKADNEIRYTYDSLGRKNEILEKCSKGYFKRTIYVYDVLDRVIEERIEDTSGKLFSRKNYTYDESGNITHITMDSSENFVQKSIEYDAYDKPLKIMHPNGGITRFFRDYKHQNQQGHSVQYEEETDPLGNTTARTYDEQGNIAFEEFRSPLGHTIRKLNYHYDGVGNLVSRFEQEINTGEDTVHTQFLYDGRNQEITTIEAVGAPDQKTTQKEYNHIGKIEKIIKPDGAEMHYLYDYLGRLTDEIDSTGRFYYYYTYDSADNIVSVANLVTQKITIREYDSNNRVVSELQENGIELKYKYDNLDRTTEVILPDDSSFSYTYDAANLTKIARDSYQLTYSYDLSGKIKQISLPFTQGNISYAYDHALRLTDIKSPRYTQHVLPDGYDSCNNLLKFESCDPVGKITHTYAYDALQQLISEDGIIHHTYNYDSRFNRTKKSDIVYDNNVLNQLLSQGTTTYNYDPNGNRRSISKESKNLDCKFDTLDRLVEVSDGSTTVTFEYDPFHRRMSKSVSGKQVYFEKYIYMNDTEIGTMDDSGKIKQLKIPGPGSLNNSASLEMDGKIYLPIHDHRGNIATLFTTTGEIIETYRYSAFGEERIFDATGTEVKIAVNPWRFSGKRVDAETGWSYFGRRYYDPEIGRWTGPDPIWFVDGTNLYAYVQNCPLTYVDPNGLWGEEFGEIFEGLTRGFADDTSFGATSWMFGEFESNNPYANGAYYAGMVGSFGVGLWNGTSEYRVLKWTLGGMYEGGKIGVNLVKRAWTYGATAEKCAVTTAKVANITESSLKVGNNASKATHIAHDAGSATQAASHSMREGLTFPEIKFCDAERMALAAQSPTKSNLRLGQKIHNQYKLDVPGRKEYILPSGKRVDFLDRKNGIIYELKPNNLRSIRVGMKQLEMYRRELQTIPAFKDVSWRIILETY